jgi:hypothetical protein
MVWRLGLDFRLAGRLWGLVAVLVEPQPLGMAPVTKPRIRLRSQAAPLRKQCALFSASRDRRLKDVSVVSVTVAELELGDIEGHVFGADLVEAANDARA